MTPYFQTFQDFMHMNGHGTYVWACYALVFGAVALLIWHAIYERKKVIHQLSHQGTKLTNKQRQKLSQKTQIS